MKRFKTRYSVSLYYNYICLSVETKILARAIIVLNTLKTSPIFICLVPVPVPFPFPDFIFSIRPSWLNLGVSQLR